MTIKIKTKAKNKNKQKNILVINSGSSSIKYALYSMPQEEILLKGKLENIKSSPKKHKAIIQKLIKQINEDNNFKIDKIGHRVVHGGEYYSETVKITDKVLKAIEDNAQFAPLHNPANKTGIEILQKLLPNIPQYAIFDTAFHQTMPKENFLYPIPHKYYDKYKIRKYGFHGISHQYLSQQAQLILKKLNKPSSKIISCHIGNGASITAILNGQSMENSMGLTTLSGVIMGTRSGDLDPEILPYLMKKEKLSKRKIEEILYEKSGVKALMDNRTSHMGEIVKLAKKGNKKAQGTITMYTNSIIKYIGAYTALMNGVDAIIFSGGVLEGNKPEHQFLRKVIGEKLKYLGIKISSSANNSNINKHKIISTKSSSCKLIVIPTEEELMIARECFNK